MQRKLGAIFFASGAAALVFETLWFRQTGIALGNSVWASSVVLAAFMAGLALGNLLVGRYGDRLTHPLRAYALLEIVIAVTGTALVFGLPHAGTMLAAWMRPLVEAPVLLNLLRLLVAFALLLVPSTAMGATLPLLTRTLSSAPRDFGRVLGGLYGWNTLGAVLGVIAAEAVLVGAFGVRGTALIAGGTNIAAALGALGLASRLAASAAARETADWKRGGRWLAAAFGGGFLMLALEVVWFRLLSLSITGHALDLALVLATVLAGIGLGGFAASAWLRRDPDAPRACPAVALAAGALCALGYALHGGAAGELVSDPVSIVRLAVPLMLPVAFLSGAFFTLTGAGLRAALPTDIATAGMLTAANTTGAALGSLAGGFLLLPGLGMERSLFVLAAAYGLVALLVRARMAARPRRLESVATACLAGSLALFPWGAMESRHLRAVADRWHLAAHDAKVALVREGLTQTVIYVDRSAYGSHHSYGLITNGYSMAADDNRSRRYMKLFVHLPVAVHPDPRRALLICYGVGSTARALADTRSLESIDVVDISREILGASRVVHADPARDPLRDPQVRVHVEDGRFFLQTTGARYDLITAEPPPPGLAGVVNLYTREHFQLIHDHLREGGIATYWLPLHQLTETSARSVLRAFAEVFPDCSLWNGSGLDLIMMGSRAAPEQKAAGPVSAEHFSAQWRDPNTGPELAELGIERPEQLGALFIGDADHVAAITGDAAPLVDDWPKRVAAPETSGFGPWQGATAAAERFASSPFIARLWPETIRDATLPYFAHQETINTALLAPRLSLDHQIGQLHAILTTTDLRAPVLWTLRSDADLQRCAAGRDDVAARYHAAVGFLAQRRYDEAALAVEGAEANPARRRDAFRLRTYALCLAGRLDEAHRISRERHASAGAPDPLPAFWAWMDRTFGIDPASSRLAGAPGS